MNSDSPGHVTPKLKLHRRIALITLAIGVVLMARQMYFDDEPGAIPLLLVLIGIAWYLITRSRIKRSLTATTRY